MRRTIESVLKKWQLQSNRLPIILRGARQVGKSYVVEKFGTDNFDSTVTVNFEFEPAYATCFDTLDPVAICKKLEVFLKKKITPGKTLLFLDEIQNCPKAIMSLRYFKEKMPQLHVIAAGSLLEFALNEEQFSFPVGRVQFLYLKPLSFHEYLLSHNHDNLIDYLENIKATDSIEPAFHELLLDLLRQYFLIGGMPMVVREFLETNSLLECQSILTSLLETYRADFPKYTTKSQFKYTQDFFEKAPGLICQHFKFSHINPDSRSSDLKIALQQLCWAGLLHRVVSTNASGIPLSVHAKEHKFKLLFLDIGLVNSANRLDFQTLMETPFLQVNSGILAEQFVGQELLAYADPHINPQLYYWERDKQGAMAEVDYVTQIGAHIFPIEVKAGSTGSLKSISQYLKEKQQPFGIRISQHPLSFHNNILSIPLYLISQLPRLVKEIA